MPPNPLVGALQKPLKIIKGAMTLSSLRNTVLEVHPTKDGLAPERADGPSPWNLTSLPTTHTAKTHHPKGGNVTTQSLLWIQKINFWRLSKCVPHLKTNWLFTHKFGFKLKHWDSYKKYK